MPLVTPRSYIGITADSLLTKKRNRWDAHTHTHTVTHTDHSLIHTHTHTSTQDLTLTHMHTHRNLLESYSARKSAAEMFVKLMNPGLAVSPHTSVVCE